MATIDITTITATTIMFRRIITWTSLYRSSRRLKFPQFRFSIKLTSAIRLEFQRLRSKNPRYQLVAKKKWGEKDTCKIWFPSNLKHGLINETEYRVFTAFIKFWKSTHVPLRLSNEIRWIMFEMMRYIYWKRCNESWMIFRKPFTYQIPGQSLIFSINFFIIYVWC